MPVITEIKKQYDNVEKWAKSDKPSFDFTWTAFRRAIAKEPKGTVLIINPFNYPVWLNFVPLVSILSSEPKTTNKISKGWCYCCRVYSSHQAVGADPCM